MPLVTRSQEYYGWRPQLPDARDRRFIPPLTEVALPSAGSLDPALMPDVFNQGKAGSCTGASVSRALMYLEALEGQPRMDQSALFAYYNARAIEGTADSDSGASIRDVVSGVMQVGLCAESLWPYNLTKLTEKPSSQAYRDAKYSVLNSYELIAGDPVAAVRSAITSKWPVEFGFTAYQSFESQEVAQTGILPMPEDGEDVVGGHAVWIWQYDDARQAVCCRNSWGPDWGDNGNFWMPYAYFSDNDLAADRWVLKSVS